MQQQLAAQSEGMRRQQQHLPSLELAHFVSEQVFGSKPNDHLRPLERVLEDRHQDHLASTGEPHGQRPGVLADAAQAAALLAWSIPLLACTSVYVRMAMQSSSMTYRTQEDRIVGPEPHSASSEILLQAAATNLLQRPCVARHPLERLPDCMPCKLDQESCRTANSNKERMEKGVSARAAVCGLPHGTGQKHPVERCSAVLRSLLGLRHRLRTEKLR